MPAGGTLQIGARKVQEARNEERGARSEAADSGSVSDFVEISVQDSGAGIPQENMEKLFQPLFTTKARGIGLGLTVCKNLTEANGGRIMAVSEEGKGTLFTVLLPMEG